MRERDQKRAVRPGCVFLLLVVGVRVRACACVCVCVCVLLPGARVCDNKQGRMCAFSFFLTTRHRYRLGAKATPRLTFAPAALARSPRAASPTASAPAAS